MAKSLRSKIKQRFRALKRRHMNQIKVKPQTQQLNIKCQKALAGIQYRQKQKKNAFLFPDDPQAHFPQFKPAPIIDLRSAYIPGSGLEWSGASRKKQKPIQHLDEIKKSKNQNMEEQSEQSQQQQVRANGHGNSKNQMNEQRLKNMAKKKKKVSKLKKTIVF